MKIKRFITAIAATAALVFSVSAQSPKYVFYFIGDGMGEGPLQATQNFKRMVHGDTIGLNMLRFPVVSQAMTWSASSPVTDSAAAGTALATGIKTKNGMLGMNPDTIAVESIASKLHKEGWGIGLVTTVAPDDATPGAFYAHVPYRKMYREIGSQFVESGYEFLAGSTLRGAKDKSGSSTGLMEEIAAAGIAVAYSPDSIDSEASRRVILLNRDNLNDSNVGYTIDSVAGQNTLPEMTRAAIDHMTAVSPDRFFLMIEGGNIDHALHANDAATAIMDIDQMDKSIAIALDFMEQHPDETLIVITADHDTGGLTIGNERVGYNNYPEMLLSQKISKDRMNDLFKTMMHSRRIYGWDDIRDFLKENLGFFDTIEVTPEEEQMLRETFEAVTENRAADQKTLYSSVNSFVAKAVDLLNSKAGYGFTTSHHTGNPVPVIATGTGAALFAPFSNNIDIPGRIMQAIYNQN